jgi:hypothetical protein
MQAHRAHAEAPSEVTRFGIEEAKRLDWQDIKRFELTCAGILLVFGYLFARAKPKVSNPTPPSDISSLTLLTLSLLLSTGT